MRAVTWIVVACLVCVLAGCGEENAPAPGKPPTMSATKPAATPATKAAAPAQPVKPAPVAPATKVATAPAGAGPVVLEAEKCTLKDCAAKDLSGASGKAVLFDKDTSEAQGTVELKKGKYKVVVYVQGASADEDAVFITIGDGKKMRVYANPRGSVVPATLMGSEDEFFTATIDKDGPCKVLLTMAEKNVYVDRVVFTRQD